MSRPKGPRPRAGARGDRPKLSQFGLFDMPENIDDLGGSDGGDSDLEAELAALSGGNNKMKAKKKPKPKLIPTADLDNLVAESLKDIPSDEDVSDIADDDPDILNELTELTIEDEHFTESAAPKTTPSTPATAATHDESDLMCLLEDRIKMYALAEQNAKSEGETSRARRFGRGMKTLKEQLNLVKSGKSINVDDIPPVVSTTKHSPAAESTTASIPAEENDSKINVPSPIQETNLEKEEPQEKHQSIETKNVLNILNERRNLFKIAALSAKKSGDNATALAHLKVVKQFDMVISAVENGQTVDISNMPDPPSSSTQPPTLPMKENEVNQQTSDTPSEIPSETLTEESSVTLIAANTIEEALQQRLTLYKQQEATAAEAGNSSKARRMGRIVKQYQQAIKLHAAGKPIPYDELPTPPGYAPIPGAPPPVVDEATSSAPADVTPKPQGTETESKSPQPSPKQSDDRPGKLSNTGRSNSVRKMGNQIGTGHVERQLAALLQRQKEFKEAALNSKKKGELNEAKEYLRCAKGIDPLIEAAKCGLPVDLSTLPLPPQVKQELEDSYDIVTAEDCTLEDDGIGDIYARLEEQLNSQLKMCMTTRDHHKALGDVAGTNRFEHLALTVKQDLDVVKVAKRLKDQTPKFHYETKQFSIVQSCTDLGENDLELTIVRGISYNVSNPKDVDTYVKFEFPFPQEEPVKDRTSLIKNTNNPEYNASFTIPINRASRPCIRVFKRQAIKLEVYSRGCCGQPCSCPLSFFSGIFTRDSIIGTVNIKLQPLETQTILHESFDLMDGRKTIGGKLEVKVRVRHPLLAKQVEQITQKWLIIDH